MKFKKTESGRSMVEMLGVLAIIGVLSVGGIAGYSLSMRRHRANQIVDAVAKYSIISYNFCHQWFESGRSDWADVSDCTSMNETPKFDESGLGPTPPGVTGIWYSHIGTGGLSSPYRGKENEVVIRVEFSDNKLCQAVASITGTGASSDSSSTCPYHYIGIKHD